MRGFRKEDRKYQEQCRLPSGEEDEILGGEKVDKEEGGKDAVRDGLGVDD